MSMESNKNIWLLIWFEQKFLFMAAWNVVAVGSWHMKGVVFGVLRRNNGWMAWFDPGLLVCAAAGQ